VFDDDLIKLGGTTSSYPAIKHSGAAVHVRLADDSDFANLNAASLTATTLVLGSASRITDAADGIITVTDAATTNFGRLQFGGTSSSYPAIKRNGAALDFRLADDSADADVAVGDLAVRSVATFTQAPVFTDQSGTRTALGLGTAATQNTGTSGGSVPLLNGANTWSTTQTFTVAPVFADASGSRTALGLGTAATQNTGASGATVPLLNEANTWSATQTFAVAPVFTDASGSRTALGLGTAAAQNTGTSGATVPLLNGANAWASVQTFAAKPVFSAGIALDSNGSLAAPGDGVFTLTNNAGTDFGRLQFGGTTSSFPALKRNGTALDVRLADDSGYADLNVRNISSNGQLLADRGFAIAMAIAL
jgi:hypothetical protein